MKATAVNNQRVGRKHPDYTQRPDSGVIWLHELVFDPKHPERIPLIKISRAVLRKIIKLRLFPAADIGRTGWYLGPVREWMRRRDALELPLPDSAQSTAKLFSPAPLSTRGSTTDAAYRVRRPGVTQVTEERDAASLNAPVQQGVGQVVPPTDSAQTESRNGMTVGESYNVLQLLRSISEGATT